ncbi:hypothetical protein D3C79_974470 [compost metagenome]
MHVFHTVDSHARHADIGIAGRIVRVIAAVRGQVESNGKALCAVGQLLTQPCISFPRIGEAAVLSDGPRTLGVHTGIGAA